jgi:hypothetical protein
MMTAQGSNPPAPPEALAMGKNSAGRERPAGGSVVAAVRAVFYREFRPHVPLALGMLGIWVVIAVLAVLANYFDDTYHVNKVGSILDTDVLRFLMLAGCPLAGFVLGGAQGRRDAGDIWGFMMHRPASRGLLFGGRVLAGLALYGIAVGVALAGVVLYSAWPGQGLPFDWRWALPAVADGMTGLVYYLAGLLMIQREARPLGTAWIPLLGAIACSVVMALVPRFWEAVVVIGASLGWYGMAALGSSASQGYRLGSSLKARWATGFVLFVGLSMLFVGGGVLAEYQNLAAAERAADKVPRVNESNLVKSSKQYVVLYDGTLGVMRWEVPEAGRDPKEPAEKYRSIERVWPEKGVPDFVGLPEKASQTLTLGEIGVTIPSAQPYQDLQFHEEWVTNPNTPAEGPDASGASEPRMAGVAAAAEPPKPNERWFFVTPPGIWQGYDFAMKTYLGSLGEDGFAPPGRKATPFGTQAQGSGKIVTARGVYTCDLVNRTVKQEWEFPAGEEVLYWTQGFPRATPGVPMNAQAAVEASNRLLAVTRERLLEYSTGSIKPVLAVPLAHSPRTHHIFVARSESTEQWVLWYEPRTNSEEESSWERKNVEVEFFDAEGKRLGHVNIAAAAEIEWRGGGKEPPLWTPQQASIWQGAFVRASVIDALGGLPWMNKAQWMPDRFQEGPWRAVLMRHFGGSYWVGSGVTLVAVAVGMGLLARRYGVRHSWAWIAGAVIFGPVMLVVLVATHTLPQRVRCAACGKMHFVAAARCPRCGTTVASPALNGTEVFGCGGFSGEAG